MDKEYSCFFISSIGEIGSEVREHSNDLRDDLIIPALEVLGFDVIRGEEEKENRKIDDSVTQWVKTADLCVADIAEIRGCNPNVYYEMGMRAETGEPLVILKPNSMTIDQVPADIRNLRFVEYDLDDRKVLRAAKKELREYAKECLISKDAKKEPRISVSQLAEMIGRIERKIDRLDRPNHGFDPMSVGGHPGARIANSASVQEQFMQAILMGNIPMMESCMDRLGFQMERMKFLDTIVSAAAAQGSLKAGNLLLESASEFMDSSMSFRSKVQYLGCMVTYLNRTDKEEEYIGLVEDLCLRLERISEGEDPSDAVQIYNQLNRLYYGIFGNTDDKKWLSKSIEALEKAMESSEKESFLHYNISTCLKRRDEDGDMEQARYHILRCIELDGPKEDADHLEEACEIFYALDDPRFDDYLEKLSKVSQTKADILRYRLF